MKPLISVITIVRNGAGILEPTMASVFAQTYPHVEYVIVDGGSTDGTAELVRRESGRLARWVSEPDRGIADALNKGAQMAQGDLILYMNAGDAFATPDALEKAVAAIPEGADVRRTIFYGQALFIAGEKRTLLDPDETQLRYDSVICHQSTLLGADLQKSQLYDERFAIAMDYDLFLRCVGRYPFVKLPVLISHYFAGGVSSSPEFVIRSVIERGLARILNGQRSFTVAALGELMAQATYIGSKLTFRRTIGPERYERLKTLIPR